MSAEGRPSPLRVAALRVYKVLPKGLSHRIVHTLQPTFTAGSVAIIEYDGRVLALRQHHRRGWSLPGGLVEAGEQPQDAVVREVREETGLAIEPGSVMAVPFGTDVRHIDILFRIECDRLPEVRVSSEALEYGWFTLDDLPEPDESTRRIQEAVRLARGQVAAGRLLSN